MPQPKSLYAIEWGSENGGMESYPDYLDLRDRNTSFESLAGYDIEEVGVSAGGGDASSVSPDHGHPFVAEAGCNLSRAIGRPIVDDDHACDVGLAQCACNGFRDEPGAVLDRDNDVDPHGTLLLSRKRRDVPERHTRERGLKQISNVRASDKRPSMDW